MKNIKHEGIDGVFIPLAEFEQGKFFSGVELLQLQGKIIAQRELIRTLEEEVRQMAKKGNLYPPIVEPVTINPMGVIIMTFTFALVFFVIGILTMHYPHLASVIQMGINVLERIAMALEEQNRLNKQRNGLLEKIHEDLDRIYGGMP